MRRLPVYIVVDSSESTIGEANAAINLGLTKMIASLRKNPYALETAWISVISFDSKARVLSPLTDILEFRIPNIEIRPGTALGAAIDLLAEQMKKEVVHTTNGEKGDFKPLVFFLTDGAPTDEWRAPLARFKAMRPKPANVYAIGCGDDVDYSVLSQLADVAFKMSDTSEADLPEMFAKLFVWLSASVQSASQGVGDDFFSKEKRTPEGIERVGDDFPPAVAPTIPNNLFIHTICQETGLRSLLRFKLDSTTGLYRGTGAYKLPPNFFSEGTMTAPSVSNELMTDIPDCPHCNNKGWIYCGPCGLFSCFPNPAPSVFHCPSCKQSYQVSVGTFDVQSSIG